jgi:putative transposase
MSIRQRLYPTNTVANQLRDHCSHARFIWNLGLEHRNQYRPHRTLRLNLAAQMYELALVRQSTPWLAAGSSSVQQQALRDLDQAFQNWWKNPGHFGRPTWRKAERNEGFRVVGLQTRRSNRKWGEVQIPKIGWVRFRLTRAWTDVANCRSARVTLNRSGQWHVAFASAQPTFNRMATMGTVGLDVGVATSIATSDGELLAMPTLLSAGEAQRKRRLERKRARQEIGSKRRERTKHQIATIRERESARRKDWIEQVTTQLVRNYDFIALEDLRIKNMVRSAKGTTEKPGKNVRAKSGLHRSIHSQSWGLVRGRLEQKALAATSPTRVVVVAARNTSRQCQQCGSIAKENRKSQAVFRCLTCGHQANADVNAAKNILAAGLAVAGRGGTPHCEESQSWRSSSGPVKRQPSEVAA